MKKIVILFITVLNTHFLFAWGQIGHRIVGEIAQTHLSRKAQRQIQKILGDESLAMSSTWMDFIRSDTAYDYTHPLHYTTIPDGKTYEEAGTVEEGDIIQTIERLIAELKAGKLSQEEKVEALRFLVHLVGDIHQPLHVGRGDDKGGNDIKVKWFGEKSNLHRVWDSDIINGQQLSYTEYASMINHPSSKQLENWQAANVREWAYESMDLRNQVYKLPEDGRLSYQYSYNTLASVEHRLLQAGVRLAGVLNDIYG